MVHLFRDSLKYMWKNYFLNHICSEPVELKVSLYVKPEERQPSKISDVTGFHISQMVVSQPSPVTYIVKKTLTN